MSSSEVMSVAEEGKIERVAAATTTTAPDAPVKRASTPSLLTRLLNLLSSVRFGVTLLVLLVVASMIGMLIMQQNVEGFEKYYVELTPSQQLVYGALGFFDIYHAWYFNALLLVLSLNIVLASIDRFPKAWTFIARPKMDASAQWLRGQKQHATLQLPAVSRADAAARISEACRQLGLKPRVTEKHGRTFVFAERNAWNRLGAYAVHVALLTIFAGGFLTAQFGHTGDMQLAPGVSSSEMKELHLELNPAQRGVLMTRTPYQLPFTVTCADIQQKLIKKDGSINADNTIDWLTRIKIKDETGERDALVHLNAPYDYRGYRFFQASFNPTGSARNITLRLTPENNNPAQTIVIPRGGTATLDDGTKIEFEKFSANFRVGGEATDAMPGEYSNPAAVLRVTTPAGETKTAYAFAINLPPGAPINAPVAGYRFKLADFEKVPSAHILSIQRDPGSRIVYTGFALLALTLCGVFFFAHQRIWALIEEPAFNGLPETNLYQVTLGGNANRNWLAFEDRFKKLTNRIGGDAIKG